MLDFQNNKFHYGISYTDKKTFLCPKIPKCASSWAEHYFLSLGWQNKNFFNHCLFDLTSLVFLREPKDRYIAGLGEFLFRHHDLLYIDACKSIELRNTIFDAAIEKLMLDAHTTPQTFFIQKLTNPIYFKVDDTLSEAVASFLGITSYKEIINSSGRTLGWRELALEYLENNELATKTLDSYLKTDYDLFNTVRFQ